MISDKALAELQLASYEYPAPDGSVVAFPWAWKDQVAHPLLGSTITAGLYRYATGEQIIVMPGTGGQASPAEVWRQWALNFMALPIQLCRPFGWVDAGFFHDIERFYAALKPELTSSFPVYAIGHSRGAPQAAYIAAMLLRDGVSVARLCCFESPRPGGAEFAAYLAPISKIVTRVDNARLGIPQHDYVCDLPFSLPLLAPYQHLEALTILHGQPLPRDPYGLFALHHMELVVAGL